MCTRVHFVSRLATKGTVVPRWDIDALVTAAVTAGKIAGLEHVRLI